MQVIRPPKILLNKLLLIKINNYIAIKKREVQRFLFIEGLKLLQKTETNTSITRFWDIS